MNSVERQGMWQPVCNAVARAAPSKQKWARAVVLAAAVAGAPGELRAQSTGATEAATSAGAPAPPAATGGAASAPSASAGAAANARSGLNAATLNPSAAEFPSTTPASTLPAFDALLARAIELRSRIAALTAALFSSKLRIQVRAPADDVRIKSLAISVDGGIVYSAPSQAAFDEAQVVYEHAVAPGPHLVGVEVERHDPRFPEFVSLQSSRFVVVVPENKLLWTHLELEDDSTMGESFADETAGEYDLRVRLEAEVSE